MYILVDLDNREVELADADDTHRFHVAVANGDDDALIGEVLAERGVGRLDDDLEDEHVWISIDALRAMGLGRTKPGWEGHVDKMIAKAAERGWVDADGTHLKAHLEFIDEEG